MPACPYKGKCYRKNQAHIQEYHPEKYSDQTEKENGTKRAHEDDEPKQKMLSQSKRIKIDGKSPDVSDSIKHFYSHAKSLSPENPLEAFSGVKNAKLVGVFSQLDGDDQENMTYPTDLPEMETFLTYSDGHYAFWRDLPSSENFLIVHSTNCDHFPKLELVGDKLEHVLCHLYGKDTTSLKKMLPKKCEIEKLTKEMKTVVTKRKKEKLGQLPNNVGIWVPVKNDIGYRPLTETPEKIKRMLTLVGMADDKVKSNNKAKLMEIVAYVQFANDECDFGMGLELGHWLWLANYRELDDLTVKILSVAYDLLDRDKYIEIVKNRRGTDE